MSPTPTANATDSGPEQVGLVELSVFIRQLEVMAQIGVHPHEHGRTQRVLIDIDLIIDAPAPSADRLGETVDYQAISDAVETLARAGHVQLVETLAQRIAHWCLQNDPKTAPRACARGEAGGPAQCTRGGLCADAVTI